MNIVRFLLALVLFAGALAARAATDGAAVTAEIVRRGDAAVAAYVPEQRLAAASELSRLYFDVFEGAGMELDLGMRSPALKTELEMRFGAINGKAMAGAPKAELDAAWRELRDKLVEAGALYGAAEADGFVPLAAKAALILLREGIEAMLVVGALAAYLRRAGGADRIWVLHAGVGLAIPLSLLTGWALTGALKAAGASRGALEGATMLLAAAVLVYVSFWLFSRREAQRWQAWIAGQIDSALTRGSLFALAGAACLAVYREGAETVLFYHALAAASPGQESALATGIGVAAALLALCYALFRQLAQRLPYGLFFGATAVLLYGLAVVFLGQAIVELQASGWLAARHLPGLPEVSWLGVSPTAQGLGAQSALLLLPPLAWAATSRRRRLRAG